MDKETNPLLKKLLRRIGGKPVTPQEYEQDYEGIEVEANDALVAHIGDLLVIAYGENLELTWNSGAGATITLRNTGEGVN